MSTLIDVTCSCGATLKAKREHAGKTAKCPKCGSVVVIPLPELTEEDVLSHCDEPSEMARASMEELLDDNLPHLPRKCPSCGKALPDGAVLCVSCGYHLQHGRRMQTVVQRAHEPLPSRPEGIDVKQSSSQLIMTMRSATQFGSLAVFMLVLLPFCCIVGVYCVIKGLAIDSRLLSSVGTMMLTLAGPGTLGVMCYALAGAYLNWKVIEVDSRHIGLRTKGPIPWPNIRSKVAVEDIIQLYIVEKQRRKWWFFGVGSASEVISTAIAAYDAETTGYYRYTYDINVVLKSGWRRRLVAVRDRRAAKYVEKRIERYLSVRETPVLSTWYQRWLLRESTFYDDRDDIDQEAATSAKSLPLPGGVVAGGMAIGCLLVVLFGFSTFSSLHRSSVRRSVADLVKNVDNGQLREHIVTLSAKTPKYLESLRGEEITDMVHVLVAGLNDNSLPPKARHFVYFALTAIVGHMANGPASAEEAKEVAREAFPPLIEFYNDGTDFVITRGEFGFVRDLSSAKLRKFAIMFMLGIVAKTGPCPETREAIPAFARALHDPDDGVLQMACSTLQQYGPQAEEAIPDLIHVLKTRRTGKETILSVTISRIGAEAIPALVEAYEDEDPHVRSRIMSALCRTVMQSGPCQEAVEAVPTLVEALADRDPRVFVSACEVLKQLGPQARQAIPALEEALEHKHPNVRQSAAGALARIRGH